MSSSSFSSLRPPPFSTSSFPSSSPFILLIHLSFSLPFYTSPPSAFSFLSLSLSQVDPYFDLYRGALVSVSPQADQINSLAIDGPQGDGGGMGTTEWLAVLRALMQKTLAAGLSDFSVTVSMLDEATEMAVDPNLKEILGGTPSIKSLVSQDSRIHAALPYYAIVYVLLAPHHFILVSCLISHPFISHLIIPYHNPSQTNLINHNSTQTIVTTLPDLSCP